MGARITWSATELVQYTWVASTKIPSAPSCPVAMATFWHGSAGTSGGEASASDVTVGPSPAAPISGLPAPSGSTPSCPGRASPPGPASASTSTGIGRYPNRPHPGAPNSNATAARIGRARTAAVTRVRNLTPLIGRPGS